MTAADVSLVTLLLNVLLSRLSQLHGQLEAQRQLMSKWEENNAYLMRLLGANHRRDGPRGRTSSASLGAL